MGPHFYILRFNFESNSVIVTSCFSWPIGKNPWLLWTPAIRSTWKKSLEEKGASRTWNCNFCLPKRSPEEFRMTLVGRTSLFVGFMVFLTFAEVYLLLAATLLPYIREFGSLQSLINWFVLLTRISEVLLLVLLQRRYSF